MQNFFNDSVCCALTQQSAFWCIGARARHIGDRKSMNSSHGYISYAVFCLKKKKKQYQLTDSTHLRNPKPPRLPASKALTLSSRPTSPNQQSRSLLLSLHTISLTPNLTPGLKA